MSNVRSIDNCLNTGKTLDVHNSALPELIDRVGFPRQGLVPDLSIGSGSLVI
jgi:hypothetical protein